ncbi:UNVERIFIED_CONTAM: hypothetical protein B566_EDAN015881, partial [Ephemera danica]
MEIVLRHFGIVILSLLTIFDSFGQLAPKMRRWAIDGALLIFVLVYTATASLPVKQFDLGSFHTYSYESTVLLNEVKSTKKQLSENAKDVGYQISAQLQVASIWQNPNDPAEKLLQLQHILHIKSRKAPSPEGFVEHKSQLESMTNDAFLVHWNAGHIEGVFVGEKEARSMLNLKRGIASLFQFKTFDIESKELDVSGNCAVQYRTSDGHTFLKTKTNCTPGKPTVAPIIAHPEKVLAALVNSRRDAKYTLNSDLSVLQSVETSEQHEMVAALRSEAGGAVQVMQEIKIIDNPGNAKPVKADNAEAAVVQIGSNLGVTFNKESLVLEAESPMCQDAECPTISKLVKENRAQLENSNLGTFRSALTFIKMINVVRAAKKDEIIKVLKSSKNLDILPQLLDLAAAAQTLAAHGAAVKVLDLASEVEISLAERYFWSLSLGSHPHETVIKDILNRSEAGVPSKKLSETLTLTLAAMTNKWLKLPGNMKKKDCKQLYIRAVRNLALPELIPQLTDLVLTGNKRTSVAAMKALYGFSRQYWDASVRDLARRVFLQLGRRYDSSARTIAADILLELGPTEEELREMLECLRNAKTRESQEVGQYTLQRLRQVSERCPELRAMFSSLLMEERGRLNGYHVLAQRGMATAFTRDFLATSSSNGSLVSTLELAGGILKRSTLDLGMFAGGLSSFISSEDPAPDDEDEVATAGMELTVLGVNVRPFIFFTGQGELMGHVWSGTGSDRTPAFQALMLLQDHSQSVPLQNGFLADISLLGAASFELAGQIQLSLWNRRANSVVEKNAGLALQGLVKVDSSFVRSQVEFTVATEPRLNLVSDVNFYNTVALCLQLRQPDSVVNHDHILETEAVGEDPMLVHIEHGDRLQL